MVSNNGGFKNMRRIYGRSKKGESNRRVIKITITPETMNLIEDHVEIGKGKYGSSLFELSARLMLALIGDGNDIEDMAEIINNHIDSPNLSRNLRILSRYLEA